MFVLALGWTSGQKRTSLPAYPHLNICVRDDGTPLQDATESPAGCYVGGPSSCQVGPISGSLFQHTPVDSMPQVLNIQSSLIA